MKINKSALVQSAYSMSYSDYYRMSLPDHLPLRPLSFFLDAQPVKGTEVGSKWYVFDDRYLKFPFIRISDIQGGNFTFSPSLETQQIFPIDSKLLNFGDVVLQTASNNVGKMSVYNGEDAVYNSHLRTLSINSYKYYLISFFNSQLGLNQFSQRGSIGGVDNFDNRKFNEVMIPIAPQNERNHIASLAKRVIQVEKTMAQKVRRINDLVDKYLEETGEALLTKDRRVAKSSRSELLGASWNFREFTDDMRSLHEKMISKSVNGEPIYLKFGDIFGGGTPTKRAISRGMKLATQWVTPSSFTDYGYITPDQSIASPKIKQIKKPTLFIVNRTSRSNGEYVGIAGYTSGKTPAHINQGVYAYNALPKDDLIYLTALINTKIYRYYFQSIGKGSKMREIRAEALSRVPLVNMPGDYKKRILNLMKNLHQDGYLDLAAQHQAYLEEIQQFFDVDIFNLSNEQPTNG